MVLNDSIEALSQSENFDNVDLIAFLGCSTAVGTDTMTHAAHNAGATVVIGTTDMVASPNANEWAEFFFACMALEFNVSVSVNEANEYVVDGYTGLYPCNCIFIGDGTFTLS